MTDSNFSWAVAVARRAVGKEGSCGGERGDGMMGVRKGDGENGVGVAFEDERSVIVGGRSKYNFGTRAWP